MTSDAPKDAIADGPAGVVRRLLADGRVLEAQEWLARLEATRPGDAGIHRARAVVLQYTGDAAAALQALERAISIAPADPGYRLDAGRLALASGELQVAAAHLGEAVRMAPGSVEALMLLGMALYRGGDDYGALDAFSRADRLAPGNPTIVRPLAEAEYALEYDASARAHFAWLLSLNPLDAAVRIRLSRCEARCGAVARAAALCSEGLGAAPRSAELWFALAQAQEDMGDAAEAHRCYAEAAALRPGWADPLAAQIALLRADAPADLVERAERLLLGSAATPPEQAYLHFALGKAADARAEHGVAFAHWCEANALRRDAAGGFDRQGLERMLDGTVDRYRRLLQDPGHVPGSVDERPVFIVGMPRSGTTLVEQVLATHPSVHGCGELKDIPQIANELRRDGGLPEGGWKTLAARYLAHAESTAAGAARLVDKQPYNFMHLGLIAALFPRARILWCRRDPRDIAISIFSENFAPASGFATALEDIQAMIEVQEDVMRRWLGLIPNAVTEVVYEEVVADFERHARRLVDFVGLPWDAACLDFHANPRAVQTFSRWQVRQPVHARSVGRWKRYAAWLPERLAGMTLPTASGR